MNLRDKIRASGQLADMQFRSTAATMNLCRLSILALSMAGGMGCSDGTSSAGTGGRSGSGGEATGGGLGSGGTLATGGSTGSGGVFGTGGSKGTGGSATSGGMVASGGTAVGGGSTATGGSQATGGSVGGGGATATGGIAGSAGSQATGGRTGSGGSAATGGAKVTGGTAATGGSGAGGSGAGGSGAGGAAAGGSTGSGTCGTGTSTSSDVVVNLGTVQQKMSGFGASTAWGATMSTADADLLWSTTSGAGLSLHRVRIAPGGTTNETSIAKSAVAHGVTVWATPWTPPAADKSNNNIVMGTLTNGQAFADTLASFVTTMKSSGVPIFAVSAQNEPDANVTYESCSYTGASMASFIGTYMGPALANSGAKIMAPETQNWCGFPGFESAILGDAKASSYVSIIATHDYGCTAKAYPEIAQAGKEFWQTEVYDQSTAGDSNGMGSALRIVKKIHDALTIASVSAWHYWWVYSTGQGGLFNTGTSPATVTKRLWIMGNYSRFVRPGYQRVGTTGSVPSGVLLTAFKNPTDGTVVVVAANTNTSASSVSVFISGAAPCSVTPYVTSSTDSMASKTALSVSAARFTYSLSGQSVTTFVGKP
jgi:glucuronoarabinoxylan endo-1,4-beta-xylanase